MDIFKQLFRNFNSSLLRRKTDIEEILNNHTESLKNKGFEVVSVIPKEKSSLILYRYFYDDIPKEEDRRIFLGIRVITRKGQLGRDPMLKAFFNENFTSISLEDIEMETELVNRGYGRILLSTLISIAKKRNINRISGWISNVDGDHWDRLEHFYKNHNFEVIRSEDRENSRKIGDILWNNDRMS